MEYAHDVHDHQPTALSELDDGIERPRRVA
jgi:hypothetical protein